MNFVFEFDYMHIIKNIFFYFLNKEFLYYFLDFEEKYIFLMSGQYLIV
jgi:hypothetical protein